MIGAPITGGQDIATTAFGPRGHAVYSGWENAIGHPSIAVPSQPSAAGMPVGVQLVRNMGTESMLLDIAERC